MTTPLHRDLYGERRPGDVPVLLVMGLGMPGSLWDPIVPRLAERYLVATFDQRGTGRSAGRPPGSMAQVARDTLGLMDELGWDEVHLVGASLGGMVALELVLAHPERVRSLALIATQPGGLYGAVPTLPAIGVLLTSPRLEDRMARWLHPPHVRAAMRGRAKEAASKLASTRTLLRQLQAILGYDVRRRLGEIRAPTLVIQPKLDIVVRPAGSATLARGIPGARLVERPNAGHGLIGHDAPAVAELLVAFFDAHARA